MTAQQIQNLMKIAAANGDWKHYTQLQERLKAV